MSESLSVLHIFLSGQYDVKNTDILRSSYPAIYRNNCYDDGLAQFGIGFLCVCQFMVYWGTVHIKVIVHLLFILYFAV